MAIKGKYQNIYELALADAKESRIVFGRGSEKITERWYYVAAKWAKIISFAAVVLFSAMVFIAAWLEMSGLPVNEATEKAFPEFYRAFASIGIVIALLVVGFVLTFIKSKGDPNCVVNLFGAVLLIIACAVGTVYFYNVMKNSDSYYDGGKTAFIWCHLVPNILLSVSALVNSLMGYIEKMTDNLRYEMVLGEAYDVFREMKKDVAYSPEEWEDFLSTYTRPPRAYELTKRNKKSKKEE